MRDEITPRLIFLELKDDDYDVIGTIGVFEDDKVILKIDNACSGFEVFESKQHDFIIKFYREKSCGKKVEGFATRDSNDDRILHIAKTKWLNIHSVKSKITKKNEKNTPPLLRTAIVNI